MDPRTESESSLNGMRSNDRIDKRWSTLEIIDSHCSLCFWIALIPSVKKKNPSLFRSYSQTTLYTKEQSFIIYIILLFFFFFLEYLSYVLSRLIIKFYTRPFDIDRLNSLCWLMIGTMMISFFRDLFDRDSYLFVIYSCEVIDERKEITSL